MKILVLSDIHALSKDLSKAHGAYFGEIAGEFFAENRLPTDNPIIAIGQLLKDEVGQIDALMCLGDMAHQGKELALLAVWRDIHDTASQLNIRSVISVTGNHDIKSRIEDIDEAKIRIEFLKSISPRFPGHDQSLSDDYHRDGIGACELGDCLIIALDTCQSHGFGGENQKTIWSIGCLTERMTSRALELIEKSTKLHVIILMHHHPLRVDEVTDPEYDQMEGGTKFIEALGNSRKNCLVMHGHKHMVGLKMSGLGANPPVVFSAASLAAFPHRGQAWHFSNQFHIVEFKTSNCKFPEGTIYSWEWVGTKWEKSKKPAMPHKRNFGKNPNVGETAQLLSTLSVTSYLGISELTDKIPDIAFLSPQQITQINDLLEPNYRRLIDNFGEVSGLIYEEKR
jgi:Calcineurin-like phosphoesterase